MSALARLAAVCSGAAREIRLPRASTPLPDRQTRTALPKVAPQRLGTPSFAFRCASLTISGRFCRATTQAGIHAKVVSERLGRATVSITLDTYSHAIPAMQEEAAALIAGLVFAAR